MKKFSLFIFFFLFIISGFFYLYFYNKNVYINFDNKLRDEMFLLRGEIPNTDKIIIVNIDEKSLKNIGQWPWSRDIISQIIVNITNDEAKIIGLDMFFAEKDMKSPYYLAKKYGLKLPKQYDINYDELFAYILSQTPTIMGYFFNLENNNTKNVLPNIPAIFIQKNLPQEYLIKAKGYIGNLAILQNNAYSAGFVNTIPDEDGVVRNVPLLISYNNIIYPSLSLEMYRAYKHIKKVIINYSPTGIDNITLGKQKIKTDRFGRFFVNYRGDKGSFKYISAVDVLNNKFKKGAFKNKFVLIGTTASGLYDLRVTPFNTVYPGVEVHANVLDNLLKGDFIYRPDFSEIIDISLLILFGILTFIAFYFFTPLLATSFTLIGVIGYFIFIYYLMFDKGYVFEIILPILEIIILSIIFGGINYFFESKKTKVLKEIFSKKVSKNVMKELIKNEEEHHSILAPKDKEITIFFSDIRSFTSISEKIANPTKVIELLNFYMTPMVQNITLHKGTVDKFIGDAIMAYWNAPVDIPNHADEAVSSAIEQIDMLHKMNDKIKKKFGVDLDIGIGINSGIATIGEMGSEGRADYTVIGDNVNLASRLEGLNKVYKTHILITQFTFELLQKDYIIRDIDLVKVKGKTKPVKIYQVLGFGKEDFTEYNIALNLYREAKFIQAKEKFEQLFNQTNDKLYEVYIDRCDYFISNPPQNFNGVWTFTTK